ncbi:MAG: glycosyltransferase family 39 protein, partial [Candidatus Rokubacteria bacterium]|nr:glycosyltransferase family 39 protein [Candidatus Rokubacteria bacterium]
MSRTPGEPHGAPHDPAAWLPWVAALLALGLQVLAITPPLLNVDEAIEGLAARRILDGEFPIFFYGQAHMGTPGVFALALLLGLHVPPALAVKLLALVVYAGFAWGLLSLSATAFDRVTARLAGLLLLLPAPYLFEWSHEGRTHYTLVLALGILLLLVAYRLAVDGGPPRRWLALGLVGGLGLWTSFLFLFYLGPALAVAATGAGRRLRRPWLALALLGFGLGGAPFWLFNLAHRLASFDFGPARVPPVELGAVAGRFLTETLPALTGPSPLPPGGPGPLGWGTAALAVAALGAGLGAAVASWRQHAPRRWAWTLLLGVALVTGVANLRSAYAQDPVRIAGAPGPLMAEGRAVDPRYALALASVLPIAEARFVLGLRWLGPGARWGLALALVALHGTLDARLALGITGQAQAARVAETRDEAAHRLLRAHGVEAVYTPRWPSLYAFRWGPALAVAHPYQEVYPPLALRVDAAARVAFLLPADDPQWTWLPASLRAAGL